MQTSSPSGDKKTKLARAGTKERIVEAAVSLFNETGVATVSTNHIAEAIGLSVGNLYYHFKNKEEIIRAIYAQMALEWEAVFTLPEDRLPEMADMERMLRGNYETLWKYRFFYREMVALLNHDPLLAEHYHAVRQGGFRDFTGLIQAFSAGGVFRPIEDAAEVERLAQVCWLVSEFYLPFLEAGGETLSVQHLENGIALLRHTLSPYLNTQPTPELTK